MHILATHNKPITYKSLARTENRFQMLETLAMFSNVQPQLQPTHQANVRWTPMDLRF
jgi:hypothetical protein